MKDKLDEINMRINWKKDELQTLLRQKKKLLRHNLDQIGCTCDVEILNYDAVRTLNIYCIVHKKGS